MRPSGVEHRNGLVAIHQQSDLADRRQHPCHLPQHPMPMFIQYRGTLCTRPANLYRPPHAACIGCVVNHLGGLRRCWRHTRTQLQQGPQLRVFLLQISVWLARWAIWPTADGPAAPPAQRAAVARNNSPHARPSSTGCNITHCTGRATRPPPGAMGWSDESGHPPPSKTTPRRCTAPSASRP